MSRWKKNKTPAHTDLHPGPTAPPVRDPGAQLVTLTVTAPRRAWDGFTRDGIWVAEYAEAPEVKAVAFALRRTFLVAAATLDNTLPTEEQPHATPKPAQ